MNEPKSKREKSGQGSFSAQVGAKATRRLRAQRHKPDSVWTGFAFFGLIGWSVVVPTLIGAAIGLWLDQRGEGREGGGGGGGDLGQLRERSSASS